MMVQVDAGQTIIHGASAEPAANVQLYSIGAVSKSAWRPGPSHCPALEADKCILTSDPEVNVKVSAAVADIVSEHLKVPKNRYFLQVMHFKMTCRQLWSLLYCKLPLLTLVWTCWQIFDVNENFFGMHGTTKAHIGK